MRPAPLAPVLTILSELPQNCPWTIVFYLELEDVNSSVFSQQDSSEHIWVFIAANYLAPIRAPITIEMEVDILATGWVVEIAMAAFWKDPFNPSLHACALPRKK
ncbi:hypothetical protein IT396_03175 [Candidatus Nomurabacteria bacterium]|nr:hypothetical protein [Candidatus Nomurabacteria bacterium]